MAKYQQFEELPVWQEAARLYNAVLDLLEEPTVPFTPAFRTQLDRSALSVSSHVTEGFARFGKQERLSAIALARDSASEVRSMLAVVKDRAKLTRYVDALQKIRALAESCSRQLAGWAASMDKSPAEGGRPSPDNVRATSEASQRTGGPNR